MEPDWKTLPSLSSLRAFELTARSGNFASAARALNVTHAAIAQRVRALEADLGIALARRSGRSVVLTDAGTRLAAHLTEGFGTIAAGVEELRGHQSEQPVQIAATLFIAQSVVLPNLHGFWRDHPEIQVSVIPSQEIVDITALGLDLAIRATANEPEWPGLNAEFLLESEIIAVGSPDLVNTNMPALDELPWIWQRGVKFEEDTLRAFGLNPDTLKNLNLGSAFLEFTAARQGLGLSFTPEILVRNDLATGQLCRIAIPSPHSIRYYVATPKGPVRPQAVAFVKWLKQVLAKQNKPSARNKGAAAGLPTPNS